jgi:hypothetical protein
MPEPLMTDEERRIIDLLTKSYGRTLTPEEQRLSLAQARAIGELPQERGEGPGFKRAGSPQKYFYPVCYPSAINPPSQEGLYPLNR